jgi:hypothetical protein
MQVRLLAGQRAGRLDIAQQLSEQRAHVLAQGFNMTILSNLTTGKDNKTHDIARWVMLVNATMLAVVLILGVGMDIVGYWREKPFPTQELFTSVLTYVGGVSALLTSGAAAIFFKRTTEPDGATEDIESITKGKQPDVTNITVTPME